MAQSIDVNLLCQRWVHVREDDTPTETVYRPAGFPLPPSRGRAGLQFDADGTFRRIGIGQTDISSVKQGTWQVDESTADALRVELDGQPQLLRIQELTSDRMTIKRAG